MKKMLSRAVTAGKNVMNRMKAIVPYYRRRPPQPCARQPDQPHARQPPQLFACQDCQLLPLHGAVVPSLPAGYVPWMNRDAYIGMPGNVLPQLITPGRFVNIKVLFKMIDKLPLTCYLICHCSCNLSVCPNQAIRLRFSRLNTQFTAELPRPCHYIVYATFEQGPARLGRLGPVGRLSS
jgi:hypothetical protein